MDLIEKVRKRLWKEKLRGAKLYEIGEAVGLTAPKVSEILHRKIPSDGRGLLKLAKYFQLDRRN